MVKRRDFFKIAGYRLGGYFWLTGDLSSFALLWSDKDREVWFFLEKNHEKVCRFPDFLRRGGA